MKTITMEEAEGLVRDGENYTAEDLKRVQQERLHQLSGSHRLGHVRHLLDVVAPFLGCTEHLG